MPQPPRPRRPLDAAALHGLAIRYVGRFATTRAKLSDYLVRKVREREWAGEGDASQAIADLCARCVELGYVDDRAYAEAKSASLLRRGYGQRRVAQSLQHAGIDRDTVAELRPDEVAALDAARVYARRRRFDPDERDADIRRKQLAAMLRAGHDFTIARLALAAAID